MCSAHRWPAPATLACMLIVWPRTGRRRACGTSHQRTSTMIDASLRCPRCIVFTREVIACAMAFLTRPQHSADRAMGSPPPRLPHGASDVLRRDVTVGCGQASDAWHRGAAQGGAAGDAAASAVVPVACWVHVARCVVHVARCVVHVVGCLLHAAWCAFALGARSPGRTRRSRNG